MLGCILPLVSAAIGASDAARRLIMAVAGILLFYRAIKR